MIFHSAPVAVTPDSASARLGGRDQLVAGVRVAAGATLCITARSSGTTEGTPYEAHSSQVHGYLIKTKR